MRVLKFGGTSVGSPENLKQVMQVVQQRAPQAVVVSAFGGFTDQLIRMGKLAQTGDESYLKLLEEAELRHMSTVHTLVPALKRKPCSSNPSHIGVSSCAARLAKPFSRCYSSARNE